MKKFTAKRIEAGVYEYRGYRIDGRWPDSMLGTYARWRVYSGYTLKYKLASLKAARELIDHVLAKGESK